MHLLNLTVSRLPGINTPFSITAKDGINLILGPNESGKSSLVRTVRHLLWPGQNSSDPIVAQGHFQYEGKTIQAESNYDNEVAWTLDGKSITEPARPADHVAKSYKLGVLDLMRPGADSLDHTLAQVIRRQMAGGFDLDALGELIPDPAGEFSRKQKVWVQKQLKSWEIANIQKALSEDQNRLQELQDEANRATEAKKREQLLQLAIRLENKRLSLIDLEMQAGNFHPGMKNLQPEDAKTLADYRNRVLDFQQQHKELKNNQDQKVEALVALDLPTESDQCDTGLVAELLKECRPLKDTLLELERSVADAADRLAHEEKSIDPRVVGLAAGSSAIPKELYHNLSRLHHDSMALEIAFHQRQKTAEETPLQGLVLDDDDAHQELMNSTNTIGLALDKFLASGRSSLPGKGFPLWGGVAFAAGVAGCIYSASGNKSEMFIISTAALACLAGGALILQWLQKRQQYFSNRLSLEIVFDNAGHALPTGWTEKSARDLVGGLTTRICQTETGLAAEQVLQKTQAKARTRSEKEFEQAEEHRQKLLRENGLPEGLAQEDLLAGLGTLGRYLDARNNLEGHRGKQQECTRQLEAAENKTRQEFSSGGIEVSGDINALTHALNQLEKKRHQRDALLQSQRDGKKQLVTVAANLAHEEKQICSLLDRLELSGDAHPDFTVARLVKEQNQFLALQASLNTNLLDGKRLQAELKTGEAHLSSQEWVEKSIPELETMLDGEKDLASRAEDLVRKIGGIETSIENTRNKRDLADARASETESLEQLAELFEKRQTAGLARVLVQETEASFEQNSRPKLLEEASRLFEIFTHYRYKLRVTNGDGKNAKQIFEATSTEIATQSLPLEKLSDGTRAQLLLAARLAFIKESESGAKPPLFLDEALTSSDPVRFAAIAGSLAQWAKESSRQIFYLTSNPTDVTAWMDVLREEKLNEPHFIDLGAIRTGSAAADPATFQQPVMTTMPHPDGMTAAEYGAKLQVPKLDPWAEENAAPLYYLLKDDLGLLHTMLQAGVTTLGRWKTQAEPLHQARIITAQQQVKLETRGEILGAFLEAWLQGRGKTLDAVALKNSNILSEKMLKPSQDLLEAVDGNAQAFMQAVMDGKVKRLQSSKKKELQNHLEHLGYIDLRPMLDADQVINHIVQTVSSELAAGTVGLDGIRTLVAEFSQALNRQK